MLPADGHPQHPWIVEQERFWPHDSLFKDEHERRTAIAAYHALCTWVDHNVGLVIASLDATGLAATTRVIYTSDHGDNVGARGLWGKSNLYQESTTVPMLMSGPEVAPGVCRTPCSLLDLFPVHGTGSDGRVVFRQQLKRGRVLAFFKKLKPCNVGIEACATSHHWAREIGALGHTVKLIAPASVKPYVKRQKNDAADAGAICEAVLHQTKSGP